MTKTKKLAELSWRIRKIELSDVPFIIKWVMAEGKDPPPIALHRLSAALDKIAKDVTYDVIMDKLIITMPSGDVHRIYNIKLRKNNRDCTLDDQSEDTLDALLSVLPE